MSLPERIQVAFGDKAISVFARDLLGRTQKETMPYSVAADPRRPWHVALESANKWISARFNRLSTVHVELADRHVHYLVLPWRTGLNGAAEWQAFGTHRLREVYGPQATEWAVRQSDPVPGRDVVTVAVHRDIVNNIRTVSRSMLRSMEPACVVAFNRHRRRLGRTTCWFVNPGPDRFCAVLLDQGRWRQVRNEFVASPGTSSLETLLGRVELDTNIIEPLPVYIASTPFGDTESRVRELVFLDKSVDVRSANVAATGP